MQQRSNMLKVITPVEGKNGKTFWIRVGNAFPNRDGSTNVYLNAYPTSGKLQIRAIDDWPSRDGGEGRPRNPEQGLDQGPPPSRERDGDELPF